VSRVIGRADRFAHLRARHDEEHRRREEERARRQGRRPLDAKAIAAAAVAIADVQGVEEVSMRKVAAVLGWGTMSLYHYVRTKDDLLAAMDDIIMGEILVPPRDLRGTWREAMGAIASQTREAYRRHPWALTLQVRGRPGINGLRHVEQSLAALGSTGLGIEGKLAIMVVVDDFVFGHAFRALIARLEEEGGEAQLQEVADFVAAHIRPAEFPVLSQTVGDANPLDFVRTMAATFRPDEVFAIGLTAMLDGLARRFDLKD
jgi:AcrR family transcriptional regulator